MAGLDLSRALIFVTLACVSQSFPTKLGGGSDSGSGAPVLAGGSGLGLHGVLAPSRPSVQGAPASSSSVVLAPGVSGRFPAGAAVSNVAPAAANDPQWEVAPQSLGGPSSDASSARGGFAPEDPSAGFFGPPEPEFTPGELSHMENTFEHGSSDYETERQGDLSGRPLFLPGPADGLVARPEGLSVSRFPGPPGYPGPYWYPFYDWMFLTGQYPPGTVSHFSSSFEQGKDNWSDSHFNKYPYPVPQGPVVPTHPHSGQPVVQVQGDSNLKVVT